MINSSLLAFFVALLSRLACFFTELAVLLRRLQPNTEPVTPASAPEIIKCGTVLDDFNPEDQDDSVHEWLELIEYDEDVRGAIIESLQRSWDIPDESCRSHPQDR